MVSVNSKLPASKKVAAVSKQTASNHHEPLQPQEEKLQLPVTASSSSPEAAAAKTANNKTDRTSLFQRIFHR
jgi:hypothetical protein